MPRYTFKTSEVEYRIVDALDLDDAMERAGIEKDGPFGLRSDGRLCHQCFMVVASDEALSG